jgi:hypothetical protein
LIAGLLAVGAAWRTIRATTESADREVKASQEQTAVAQKQIETTVRLEQDRVASEASAFHAMLAAAMDRVLAEADLLRTTYPNAFARPPTGVSVEAHVIRQCITKSAFAELRAACVQRGGSLTGEFLELERKIDDLSSQAGIRTDLGEQLASIKTGAKALHDKAAERI